MVTTNNLPAKTPRKLFRGVFQDLEPLLATEIATYKKQLGPLAPIHVLCPTRLLALHLSRSLPQGHINVRFTTITDFASQFSNLQSQIAPHLGLQLLCRRIALDLLSKKYFAPIHDTVGFASALLATFTDLDEAGITPADFAKAARTPKHRELAIAHAEFRSWLATHNFHTEADLYQSEISNIQSPIFLYGFYDLNAVQRRFVERLAPAAVFFPTGNKFTQPLLDWLTGLGYTAHQSPISNLPSPISLLSCPGEPAEVREAVRTALNWLRQNPGRTFNDIAILTRTRDQYDVLLRDTFQHLALPAFVRGGRPLAELADAKLLLLLLETIATDFSRAHVMELASHGTARPRWDELSLELGITTGHTCWRDRLARDPNAHDLAAWADRLFHLTDAIPATGTWTTFITPVLEAWRALGGQHTGTADTVRALAGLEPFQTRVTLAEFATACRQALEQQHEPTLAYQAGGIFVGDVMSARGLSWPLVIILGLVEKTFPRVIREDPLLLDDERAAISRDLSLKRRGYDEERLLFDLTCAAALKQLVLSYPRLDPGSARPRLRSCLLRQFTAPEQRVPLAQFDHRADALDDREFDVALLKDARRIAPTLLAAMSPHLAQGLAAEHTRWSAPTLTAFDGLAPATGVALEKLVVAPTQLETFAFCPFKYFCKQTLALERWDEPERIWSADPGEIGSVVHDILEAFYKQATLPLQPRLRELYWQQLRDIAGKELARFEREGVTGLPVVWSLRQAALLRDLLKFLDLEIARADDLIPREFEKKFGPVPLRVSSRLTLSVKGRIDRLDVAGNHARVLDYKTGKAYHKKDDTFDGGEALQLPLYALAAEELFQKQVVSSEYAYLTERGEFRYVRFTRDALQNRAGDLATILETFAAMLRAGDFPQYTGHNKCGYCDYRPICGHAIEQLAARKIEDARLAPFLGVKEIA